MCSEKKYISSVQPPAHSNCSVKQRFVAEYPIFYIELVLETLVFDIHEEPLFALIVLTDSTAL